MGWDAFATYQGQPMPTYWRSMGEEHRKETRAGDKWPKHIKAAFTCADRDTVFACETADCFLRLGGLDCSACAEAIQEATGETCWTEEPWTPERVKEIAAAADWDRVRQECWAKESARAFLNLCAKYGLGIYFSF